MDFFDEPLPKTLANIVAKDETLDKLIWQVERLSEDLQNRLLEFEEQNKNLPKTLAKEETIRKIFDEIEYLRNELMKSIEEVSLLIPQYSYIQRDIADAANALQLPAYTTATVLIWIEITLVFISIIGCVLLWRLW